MPLRSAPPGQTFALFSFGNYAVELFDAQSGSAARVCRRNQSIGMLTFSPDGRQMAITTGADDMYQTVGYLWDFHRPYRASNSISKNAHLIFKPRVCQRQRRQ